MQVSDTKVENQYYFTDRIIETAYDIIIDNHHDKRASSQLTFTSEFNKIGIAMNHVNKIMEEMSHVYAKLKNEYNFNYHLTFLVIFNKYGEDGEIISEKELPFTLSLTHNLT